MKRTAWIIVFILIVSLPLLAKPQQTLTGFYWPTGTSNIGKMAKFLAAGEKEYFSGYYHLGWDIKAQEGDIVYSISDGKIIRPSKKNWGKNNVALLIEHKTSESIVTFIYGHLREDSIPKNKIVKAGQPIGKIGSYDPTHLHFGAYLGGGIPKSGFGRQLLPEDWKPGKKLDSLGFVDPVVFINTKQPFQEKKVAIPLYSPTPAPTPISNRPKIFKLVSTGPETNLPNYQKYQNCQISASWKTGIFYTRDLACDRKNQVWVGGDEFKIYNSNGEMVKNITDFTIGHCKFTVDTVYRIDIRKQKLAMITNFLYGENYPFLKLSFLNLENPNGLSYKENKSDKGSEKGQFGGMFWDMGITILPSDEIIVIERTSQPDFVTDNGSSYRRMQKFSSDGKLIWVKNLDPFVQQPACVDSNSMGNIYIGDPTLNCVHKFNSDGQYLSSHEMPKTPGGDNEYMGSPFQAPYAICIDQFDRIFVSKGRGCIQVFDPNFKPLNGLGYIIPGTPSYQVVAMDIDQNGIIYVSNLSGDILKIKPSK